MITIVPWKLLTEHAFISIQHVIYKQILLSMAVKVRLEARLRICIHVVVASNLSEYNSNPD
jgi:hypothetical protein